MRLVFSPNLWYFEENRGRAPLGGVSMAFKRKIQSEPAILEHFKGGEGCVQKWDILKADEMYGKGRVCSLMALAPGHEVGRHRHEGDGEVFYILSGKGKYLLDGELVEIEEGDVLFVDDGEEHYMVNTGEDLLKYLAIVLFSN